MHSPQHGKMMGPLGGFGIARSYVETPGYAGLLDPMTGEPMEGGGGGGFSMGFGGQRGPNQMEQTIDAHNYPGGFKVATDQYAARYSDQLNEAALLEMKDKFRDGPASGGSWDDFAAQRQNNINNYYKTGELFGPVAKKLNFNKPNQGGGGPLQGRPSRNRDGISRIGTKIASPGTGGNRTYGGRPGGGNRIGGRYGL